jgi:ATP/maltotriose-dependent transcriptional regulator MalT
MESSNKRIKLIDNLGCFNNSSDIMIESVDENNNSIHHYYVSEILDKIDSYEQDFNDMKLVILQLRDELNQLKSKTDDLIYSSDISGYMNSLNQFKNKID